MSIYLKYNNVIRTSFDPSKHTFKYFMDRMKEILEDMDEQLDYATFFNNRYLEIRYNVYDHEMRVGNYITRAAVILEKECTDEELIYAAADAMNEMFANPNEEASKLKKYRFVFSGDVKAIGHSKGNSSILSAMDKPTFGLFNDLDAVRRLLLDQEKQSNKLKKTFHALEEEAKNKDKEE